MGLENYYILEIRFDPDLEDVVQGRLFLTPSAGNQLVQPGLIEAYFATEGDRDAAAALFENAKAIDRPRTDWLQLYQQSLQPIFIGRSFVVAPEPSLIPNDSGRQALIIPQASAFGTGSHESTALCIELLEEMDLRGKRALDIGTGSGILALAMLRLGARKVIGFDIDLDAFRPLRENRECNDGRGFSFFIGAIDALGPSKFDVITMNILPEVIVPMLPRVFEHAGGPLIVSGILTSLRHDVARHARVVRERTKGEWWAASIAIGD
jgi:ribosomal protein L11 methyltransferase